MVHVSGVCGLVPVPAAVTEVPAVQQVDEPSGTLKLWWTVVVEPSHCWMETCCLEAVGPSELTSTWTEGDAADDSGVF